MGNFKEFITENAQQEEIVKRAMTSLYYQKGYDPETIGKMPIQNLMQDIQELGLLPEPSGKIQLERFAAMVKMAANMHNNNMQITPTTEDE